MPIYEYRCAACGAKTSVLVRRYSDVVVPKCATCGGEEMVRLFSTFAYHRAEGDRLAEFDTSRPRGEDYYRDSRNVGLWAKKRARELGADAETIRQVDEVVEQAKEKALSGKLFDQTPGSPDSL